MPKSFDGIFACLAPKIDSLKYEKWMRINNNERGKSHVDMNMKNGANRTEQQQREIEFTVKLYDKLIVLLWIRLMKSPANWMEMNRYFAKQIK